MEKIVNLKVARITHVGHMRERNEDALFVSTDQRIFAVADGMGGMAAGDLASNLVVSTVETLAQNTPPNYDDPDDIVAWVANAMERANGKVLIESYNLGLDMGTTLIAGVMATNGVFYWGHLGDSRIYTTKEGCVTEDHAVGAHELTNFAGRGLSANPDLGSIVCEQGMRVLLTTDGLNKVVSDEEIMEVMTNSKDGEEIVNTLLELALDYGGPDNVTMILLDHV